VTETIVIRGGLSADSSEFATIAGRLIERGACEDVETFRTRVLLTARASNEIAVFGGLPPMNFSDDEEGQGGIAAKYSERNVKEN
jgi:hypothetical protein